MKFGRKLAALRRERGFSQERLAERIGVSRQAVAKWEAGESFPELPKLLLLGDCFRQSLDRLVRDHEDERCRAGGTPDAFACDDDFLDFLCRAKRCTYAGKGAECASSRPASHDLVFREGALVYLDSYLGGERFAGEEAVWRNGTPIWAMNYAGRTLDETFSGDFLKEALTQVTPDLPYRGPRLHVHGDFAYHCHVTGEPDWFEGHEEVFCLGRKVYECRFHGGSIA